MDKISTDGEEQLPSSLTGGQPNLQPSKPYLQQAAIQPYRRPTHSATKHPNPAATTPTPQPKPLRRRGQSSETTE